MTRTVGGDEDGREGKALRFFWKDDGLKLRRGRVKIEWQRLEVTVSKDVDERKERRGRF